MPTLNSKHWMSRFGEADPCHSGDFWLDWVHGKLVRRGYRRAFPRDCKMVLDVGCGDGRFSRWMGAEFDVSVIGADAIEFPGVRERIPFELVDGEQVHRWGERRRMMLRPVPDVVAFSLSLTCMANWRESVASAVQSADRVIACDNFQTPTPDWFVGLSHRTPVTQPELIQEFERHGFTVERAVAVDYFHRKLFLLVERVKPKGLQRWLKPVAAIATLGLDWCASGLLKPLEARHVCFVFARALKASVHENLANSAGQQR